MEEEKSPQSEWSKLFPFIREKFRLGIATLELFNSSIRTTTCKIYLGHSCD